MIGINAGLAPVADQTVAQGLTYVIGSEMFEYSVEAFRIDAHGSEARTKNAAIVLDTDVSGRPDAFNPAELFLAAIAACMIKA